MISIYHIVCIYLITLLFILDFLVNLLKLEKYDKGTSPYMWYRKSEKKRNCRFNTCAECTSDLHCAYQPIKPFCGYHDKCVSCRKNINCPGGQFCQAGSCQFGDGLGGVK